MEKISIEQIKEFNPCQEGIENLINHYPKFNYNMVEFLQLEYIPYEDKIWLVIKMVDYRILQKWSLMCADFVKDNFNKEFPNDNRINDCLEKTRLYLAGEIDVEELRSARSAASAARNAESVAWSARSTARNAESVAWSARSAARSAESAARSAESAARSAASAARSAASAARNAARNAESTANQEYINLSFLISLLEEEGTK